MLRFSTAYRGTARYPIFPVATVTARPGIRKLVKFTTLLHILKIRNTAPRVSKAPPNLDYFKISRFLSLAIFDIDWTFFQAEED